VGGEKARGRHVTGRERIEAGVGGRGGNKAAKGRRVGRRGGDRGRDEG